MLVALVDEVAGQDDQVGVLRLGQVDGLAEVGGGDVAAAVEVGELDDAEAGEGARAGRRWGRRCG